MLRFEAIMHNTRKLGVGRVLERFPEIVTPARGHGRAVLHRLGLHGRRFIPDGTLDQLPVPSQIGATGSAAST